MRTLIGHDSILFGLYHEDSHRAAMSTRLEIPGDANFLNDGEYSLPLYARTNNFEDYERVEIADRKEFRLPQTRKIIGVPYHTVGLPLIIPYEIITRDGRIFLESSRLKKISSGDDSWRMIIEEDLEAGLGFAKGEFTRDHVWVHDRGMLERIEREGFPVIVEQ